MRVQVSVARVQVQPAPPIAVGTSVCSTSGKVSTTVTVPMVGPAFGSSLTMMVYVAPICRRSKSPLWVLEMLRFAFFANRVAVAVLPVPPFAELTGPVVFT